MSRPAPSPRSVDAACLDLDGFHRAVVAARPTDALGVALRDLTRMPGDAVRRRIAREMQIFWPSWR